MGLSRPYLLMPSGYVWAGRQKLFYRSYPVGSFGKFFSLSVNFMFYTPLKILSAHHWIASQIHVLKTAVFLSCCQAYIFHPIQNLLYVVSF